jgi:hypothetical protein
MNDRRRVSHDLQIDDWICRDPGHLPERPHVDQQDDVAKAVISSFTTNPVVSKEAPRRPE